MLPHSPCKIWWMNEQMIKWLLYKPVKLKPNDWKPRMHLPHMVECAVTRKSGSLCFMEYDCTIVCCIQCEIEVVDIARPSTIIYPYAVLNILACRTTPQHQIPCVLRWWSKYSCRGFFVTSKGLLLFFIAPNVQLLQVAIYSVDDYLKKYCVLQRTKREIHFSFKNTFIPFLYLTTFWTAAQWKEMRPINAKFLCELLSFGQCPLQHGTIFQRHTNY